MRLALIQSNPVVGDIGGNAAALLDAYWRACERGADLVVSPELALTGYPPEDLVLKSAFVDANVDSLRRLAGAVGGVPFVVGFVERLPGREATDLLGEYDHLANAAAVLRDGAVEAVYRKQRLPNYGVFDEKRYFHAGDEAVVFDVGGVPVGVTVCEDQWAADGPVAQAAAAGARVVVNVNASPFVIGKRAARDRWALRHTTTHGVWFAYLNMVGGQDDVVFDGDSFLMAPSGRVVARAAQFSEDLLLADIPASLAEGDGDWPEPAQRLDPDGEAYTALVLATRDYARKNGFSRALLGLSGGVDSALVAAIAADALGADRVTTVAMPSPYSSQGSLTDAEALAANLGVRHLVIPIDAPMKAFDEALGELFAGTASGLAEENVQSRIRGSLLMAISNKFGDLLLSTGNKSEYAVGYATLYGDMAGGFAPIKDVSKTRVYRLCRWRNAVEGRDLIPRAILDKEPSAELRPDQRDSDSLPPYQEVLDPILECYVERDRSVAEIVAETGLDAGVVAAVAALVDRAEYKRRQSAPGPKITPKAFGKDRRVPITQAWTLAPGATGDAET
ncbi:MAG TPA: NAD+ synthase [Egibacteraceae bacterium]|nr:NAD+ synthase [Egibacteraceae bacterium]